MSAADCILRDYWQERHDPAMRTLVRNAIRTLRARRRLGLAPLGGDR